MNNILSNYEVILWDFDGVIMDSMTIRSKGFETVLQEYPMTEVQSLMKYHLENGGLSRYHKFKYFFESIRNEAAKEEKITALAGGFSSIMLKNLADETLLIRDSLSFIKAYYKKYKMHIVSGSDGLELREICQSVNINQYFVTIQGSPTPKIELVAKLLEDYRYHPDSVVLIGDSYNDLEAASENGIDFVGYNNLLLKGKGKGYLDSF